MSDPNRKWMSHFDMVIPNEDEPTILMEDRDGIWSLPSVHIDKNFWWRDIGRFNRAIREEMSHDLKGLRCVSSVDDTSDHIAHRTWLMENCGQPYVPDQGTWVGREGLSTLRLAKPEQRSVILGCLDEIEGVSLPYRRPPWTLPGWSEPVVVWFEDQLRELGHSLISPIEPDYSWPLSTVLIAPTTAGDIYLKVTSDVPLMPDEPVLTACLANLFPDCIPAPLGINSDKGWMLLPDLGYPIRDAPKEQVTKVVDLLAQTQIRSADFADELLEKGCVDRRLDKLEAQVDSLVNVDNALAGLQESEREQLRGLAPRLKDLCRQLSCYDIPHTLVHGDMHLGNVALRDGRLLLFDWGQSCLSHPFFDMLLFDADDLEPEARNQYLEFWTRYEPKHRLLEAWELARPLSILHHAIEWVQINTHLKPEPEEMIRESRASLRNLLEAMT